MFGWDNPLKAHNSQAHKLAFQLLDEFNLNFVSDSSNSISDKSGFYMVLRRNVSIDMEFLSLCIWRDRTKGNTMALLHGAESWMRNDKFSVFLKGMQLPCSALILSPQEKSLNSLQQGTLKRSDWWIYFCLQYSHLQLPIYNSPFSISTSHWILACTFNMSCESLL